MLTFADKVGASPSQFAVEAAAEPWAVQEAARRMPPPAEPFPPMPPHAAVVPRGGDAEVNQETGRRLYQDTNQQTLLKIKATWKRRATEEDGVCATCRRDFTEKVTR